MLNGYKTYVAAFAAFLIAVGAAMQAYANGEIVPLDLVIQALIALAMVFLRKGIQKKTEVTNDAETP